MRIQRMTKGSLAGAMILALAVGCDSQSPIDPDPGAGQGVAEFLTGLPGWAEFSSDVNTPDQPPAPTGEAPDTTIELAAFEEYGDSGDVVIQPEVSYQCITTEYSMAQNPREIVMYSPDASVLWPGGLIQGQSRKALGSLLPLPIEERTPLRITIPDIASSDNTRTVENPNEGTMFAARGEIVGNATASGLAAPSSIDFYMNTHHSEKYQALSASLSGAYMGYSASATGDFSRAGQETTVTANFIQKMFTVIVQAPQTPEAFFSSDFTDEKLQEQVNLGRMGPSNIPIYVSEIVYGRMMTFSMTSSASASDIRGTIQAAYEAIGQGVQVSLSARQQKILERSKIAITSVGGDGTATAATIRDGDLSAYFTDQPPLSSAAPISFTFRNLGDGSIAGVTESTEYDVKECQAIPATPGTFTYLPKQEATAPFGGGHTMTGDVNGDGKTDMIWNNLSGMNQLFVGLSEGDGTFAFTSPFTHPANPVEGWSGYTVHTANLNGDDYVDLVWSRLGNSGTPNPENKTYVGYGNGDGTFGTPSVRIHAVTGWEDERTFIGDAMGPAGQEDGLDDILWPRWHTASFGVSTARTDPDSVMVFQPWWGFDAGMWTNYDVFVHDQDGDGDADIVLNHLPSLNRTWWANSDGDGTWTFVQNASHYDDNLTDSNDWSEYTVRVGDTDQAYGRDLIWIDSTNAGISKVSTGMWNGSGYTFGSLQQTTFDNQGVTDHFTVEVLDVEGDGLSDIVWNLKNGFDNLIYISRGTGNGNFDFSVARVRHPDQDESNWSAFQLYTGDINGDGRDDLIWNHPAITNRIYTAIGKR